MKKSLLLLLISSLLFSCSKKEKPNVLFLFIDDLAYDAVASYGNDVVKTPNIDRIASKGTRFSHAYNMGSWSGAVCTASRSMIISGLSVWRANQNRELWHNNDSTSIANTWGKLMEKQGYDTYMAGKWHVDVPADVVFQETRHIRPGMPGDGFNFKVVKEMYADGRQPSIEEVTEKRPNGYFRPLSSSDNSWSPTDTSKGGFWKGGKHWSEVLLDDAKEFIGMAEKKENPFFMYLAFNAAHDPRQAPQEYLDMYPLDEIKIPENFMEDYMYHEEVGAGPLLRDEALAPFPRTEYAIKVHLQEYYALITHLDIQIGNILKELEDKGLLDDTYVFLTADHGLAMGSHGLLGKQNMYDHSMRVPLMVMGPDVKEGLVVDADVHLQDVMASALDVAGIEKPDFVEFNSLMPYAKGTETKTKLNGVYGAYLKKQRMMRKDGFKLIVYPEVNRVLLYDMTNDPQEIVDLGSNPEYATKKKELMQDLLSRQKELGDDLDLGNASI
ncbi:Arylsulfatase A [Spirosomataceae bacterium TFI 002]|nr:Arylsulfatase A [Spirosomataceae bacterium TFI 002]